MPILTPRSRALSLVAALAPMIGLPGPASAQPGGGGYVAVGVQASDSKVAPGGVAVLAITLDHEPGWHSHTHDPQLPASWVETGFVAIPTRIEVTAPEGVRTGPIQWPEEHIVEVDLTGSGLPEPYGVYADKAVAFVPVHLPEAAAGNIEITVAVSYQACDDTTCDRPRTERVSVLMIAADPGAPAVPTLDAPLFASFDAGLLGAAGEPAGDPAATGGAGPGPRPKFLGFIPLPSSDGAVGVLVLAAVAILGGLVLNLTPCVLPVIPIKVLTISKHAGDPARSIYLGGWMALGVIAFWAGIGLPVALFTSVTDPSRIFGIWWVTLGIGVVIAAMGVGIMGAFNIALPQKVYAVSPKADTAWGSFLFGVMTAVLGLPCFGFVAGALLAGAATLPGSTVMIIFTALGVGMALPYFVLALKPSLINRIPRTGPASELVKQVMGLLLLAAAAYFVGAGVGALLKADPVRAAELPVWVKAWHWWAIAAFAVAAGVWLAVRTVQITKRAGRRLTFVLAGVVIGGASVAIAANRTGKILDDFWLPYTEQAYHDAISAGDVVVIDFTADWCINCQVLKATVLDREPVKSALRAPGVRPLLADNTSDAAPGWAKLEELGQTGIPLLVIAGPGLAEPWMANAYTSGAVLDAIEAARGDGRATASR
ncbi:MAG TPA: cytochrome c biogenesis protein CcdA [Phycisphaerales bacterium]|nr:cytochrome c biogenesis protein CcdA [Phycisphaerales bacterium]